MKKCYVCQKTYKGKDQDYCPKCVKLMEQHYELEKKERLKRIKRDVGTIKKILYDLTCLLDDISGEE